MKDHMDIRVAVGTGQALGRRRIEVDLLALSALLDDLDAMRARAKARPEKAAGYPAPFEEVWAAYPSRPGASKATAYAAWTARINAGATPAQILDGVRKYAAYVLDERTEKRFIKQPATFFGPGEHYLADWSSSSNGLRNQANEEAKRRLFGGYDEFGSMDAQG